MQQVYHLNAETNIHIRRPIKESSLTNFQLAQTFLYFSCYHEQVENGETNEDKSSRPHRIVYVLNELEEVSKANYIERLIQPNTPKTNGMVERANGIIKKETIIKENYAKYLY